MCITSQGMSIKVKVNSIGVMGRAAQGVKIVSIEKPDFVIGVDRIVKEEEDAGQGELGLAAGGEEEEVTAD
jgi:DNA gyrase subunit A